MKITVNKKYSFTGHKDCVYNLKHAGDEYTVFSASGDGIVARWDLRDPELGKSVAKVDASVYAIKFLDELQTLVVGQNYEGIHLVDLEGAKPTRSLKLTKSQIFDIQYFDGKLFVGTGDGMLTVVDYDSLAVVKHIKVSDRSVRSIALNPQLGDMAVGLSDSSVRIFDLMDLVPKYRVNAHKLSVFSVAYSRDNRFLVSGSRDAHLKFWDTFDHYRLKESVVAHMYAINSVGFSADGNFMATGSMDKTVKIWDAKDRKLLKVIDRARYGGHTTSVNKVLWTKVGHGLLSASDDRTISLWELAFDQ